MEGSTDTHMVTTAPACPGASPCVLPCAGGRKVWDECIGVCVLLGATCKTTLVNMT